MTLRVPIAALCLCSAFAAAEPVTLVNIASDGASGQHIVTVVSDSLVQKDPLVEKSIKHFIVLEEPKAHAPPTPRQVLGQVTTLLNDAKAAYGRNAVDAAVEALAQAEAMVLSTEPLPEAFATLSDLERINGLVALKQKDSTAADDAFRQAIALDPTLTQRDSAMGSYARVLKNRSGGTGRIDIRVDPLTAWVLLDGQKSQSGVTPPLEAGTHYVSASREGYVGQLQRVIVYRDKTTPAKLSLAQTSNEAELLAARTTLLAAQSDGALAIGAKHIAELTHVRYVALIRGDDIAIYDHNKTQMMPFEPVPEAADHLLTLVRGAAPAPIMTQQEIVAQQEASKPPPPETPIYKKPWAWGVVAGGVVVIGGVIALSVYGANQKSYRYSVDNWCHAADCPPAQ